MNNTFDELCEKTFENDEEIISMKENQTFEKNFNLEKFPDKSNKLGTNKVFGHPQALSKDKFPTKADIVRAILFQHKKSPKNRNATIAKVVNDIIIVWNGLGKETKSERAIRLQVERFYRQSRKINLNTENGQRLLREFNVVLNVGAKMQ